MIKNGITLLSAYDPQAKCRKIADAVSISNKTLFVCPSPIYGYGLDTLLDRLKKDAPDSAVLCVEADPKLNEQLAMSNEQLIDNLHQTRDKICFTNICEPEKLCALVREKWGPRAFRGVEMVKLTGGWQLYPDLYNLIFETLQKEIANDWSNVLTLTKLGRLYICNMLRNLSFIQKWKSISELDFGDSAVLVLGAGPSLDETLDKLPVKRSFKIVCVDTCLGALKDRNIVPDLVVILESQHWNLRDFTGMCGWNIPIAFDMSALPQSASVLAGDGYLFFTPWTELSIFNRMKDANLLPETIPPLGSVGVTAMHIAKKLTTGKITHAGFDFCFEIDKYHARGTPGHKAKLNKHNRFSGLIGTEAFGYGVIREGDKYTTPNMRGYRELFDQELKREDLAQRRRGAENAEGNLGEFIKSEIDRLLELRDILTGKNTCYLLPATCNLLKDCNYLWSHFPDYAGGVEPNCEDISFLNRVRIEIDNMLKLLEGVQQQCQT